MSTVSEVKAARSDQVEPPAAPPVRPAWLGVLDAVIRCAGFVVALSLAAGSAMFEALLTPLYWGQVRFPLALLLAVLGNAGLVWFTVAVTGRRLAVAGPALTWTVVQVAASTRTTEGDLVLTSNNWVGIATMLVGSVTFGVAGFLLIRSGVRPAGSGPVPPP